MASRALLAVVATVLVIAGTGAAAAYLQLHPAGSPAGAHGPGGNGTNATGPTTDQLTTDGNNRMTLSVPLVGTSFVAADVTDHFNMPMDVGKVDVNISWDRSGWDLELATGTGYGPDNGTVKASEKSVTAGPVTLEFKGGYGGACAEGPWFIYAACNDPASHRGGSVTFSYTVTVRCCG